MERFRKRLNQPPDLRQVYWDKDNWVYTAESVPNFDQASGKGELLWRRRERQMRTSFLNSSLGLMASQAGDWSGLDEAKVEETTPFEISFISERCVRLRVQTRPAAFRDDAESLILASPPARSEAWQPTPTQQGWAWRSAFGELRLKPAPWSLELLDPEGRSLLRTRQVSESASMVQGRPTPFSFVQRAGDHARLACPSFSLAPGERLFGCGESFTRLDKRGQVLHLAPDDCSGVETAGMYKPVPFWMSDRGWAAFVHSACPLSLDLGQGFDDTQAIHSGDGELDLFLFIGSPKQVLAEYTALTGRSPRPPIWSFGLWMSRISYFSEDEVRGVAAKLREHRIPCDLIHLDTGWFEQDWCCDYRFSPSRFRDPKAMMADLRAQGLKTCLWQLPYFIPANRLYPEIVVQGLQVKPALGSGEGGQLALDFSNPATVEWYQRNLEGLFEQGVAAIKVDFGEAAPWLGRYASGASGWEEHCLYPLRYQKAAAELSTRMSGEHLIWARAGWAGCQRYPLHWGGDAEASDGGMLCSLRGGLSLGLSGFSFWSHDAGGFYPGTPEPLYRRWLPFAALSSHTRCHGIPPTEPWEIGGPFLELFRSTIELRYRLMPYLWAQATDCAAKGLPMLRPLFLEFPEDPGSWQVEDAYLLGSDILVAPLFEDTASRRLHLPPGAWVDLQSGQSHQGPGFVEIAAGPIPCVILGRAGRLIPTLEPALHTGAQDWSQVELWALGQATEHRGLFCGKEEGQAKQITHGPEGLRGLAPGVQAKVRALA